MHVFIGSGTPSILGNAHKPKVRQGAATRGQRVGIALPAPRAPGSELSGASVCPRPTPAENLSSIPPPRRRGGKCGVSKRGENDEHSSTDDDGRLPLASRTQIWVSRRSVRAGGGDAGDNAADPAVRALPPAVRVLRADDH